MQVAAGSSWTRYGDWCCLMGASVAYSRGKGDYMFVGCGSHAQAMGSLVTATVEFNGG